jgi:linoleate 10R-lipoxygenase
MAPRGEGNAVSIEFNLMYRWHATLSEHDTDWITEKFQALFPGQDLGKLMPADLGRGYGRMSPPVDPRDWSFGGLVMF